MTTAAASICKYILVFLMVVYTIGSFTILFQDGKKRMVWAFYRQIMLVFLFHTVGFLVLILQNMSMEIITLYILQVLFMIIYIALYRTIYKNSSRIILSHMMMFLALGFIILTRLNFEKSSRQFIFICGAGLATLIVPKMFAKLKAARKWAGIMGVVGLVLLTLVLFMSKTYGANLSLTIGGFSLQPSEFVKISFVLLIAVLLRERTDLKRVLFSAGVAGIHVLVLVTSTDLGGALIFALTYIFVLYASTHKAYWLIGGFCAGIAAAIAAYFMFSHVRVRVQAWMNPWPIFSGKGSQIGNSLFGLANGGWMGTGLYQGAPGKIPVVEKDFIFSAIVEEMGAIIGICVILICISCLVKFIQVATQLYLPFYRLTGLGLACVYGIQVLLTIGGNIKFIPSTGVTLPLVSYGGSSICSTFILFGIMQELFIKRRNEEQRIEQKRKAERTEQTPA